MKIQHHVGPGQDEVFVAALEGLSTEVFGSKQSILQTGAGRSIEAEDS